MHAPLYELSKMLHDVTFCFRLKYESDRAQPSIAEMSAIAEQVADATRAAKIEGLVVTTRRGSSRS